jgi:purine nucleoside phosphorylase
MGAGVAFFDMEEKYVPVLEELLAKAAKES